LTEQSFLKEYFGAIEEGFMRAALSGLSSPVIRLFDIRVRLIVVLIERGEASVLAYKNCCRLQLFKDGLRPRLSPLQLEAHYGC